MLFVLLSVAAVLLAVMILRETSPGGSRTGSLGPAPVRWPLPPDGGRRCGTGGRPRPVVAAVPFRTETGHRPVTTQPAVRARADRPPMITPADRHDEYASDPGT
ncbi:hypothetical protein HBB16_04875 [Pseudonocardia sp. MCCB 268]|nr:hypothetical protein [Pseudonocardia cytotoxica]